MDAITLSNLSDGYAEDLFNKELRQTLANIQDPRTVAEKPRTITLTLKLMPDASRQIGSYELTCTSKLLPAAPVSGKIEIKDADEDVKAYEV